MSLGSSCLTCSVRGPHCFCALSREALHRLDTLGRLFHLKTGKHLLDEGYAPNHVYVICGGTIKLTTSSRSGRLLLLRIAGPGDVMGLAAALRDAAYEGTAETLEPCDIKAIPRPQFLRFMAEFADVGRSSAEALARDYDATLLSARRLALSTSAAGKLASVLVQWGEMTGDNVGFRMPLTHEELGHMAGISRETTTRVLSRFREGKLLEQRGEWMYLGDRTALRALYA